MSFSTCGHFAGLALRRRRGALARRGVAALSVLLMWGPAAGEAAAATGATIQVTPTVISRPVPPGFLGLAIENREVPQLAGPTASSVNPVFVQLLRNLDPLGNGVLRVGGQSTDRSWWPVPGMKRPLGITYNLSPRWAADARALAQATGTRLILGIELEANRRRIASMEARRFIQAIGRPAIAAFEIGNEPELYRAIPWYRRLNGRPVAWSSRTGSPVYNRPPSYGPKMFLSEFRSIVGALPDVPIAGPSTGLDQYLSSFAAQLGRIPRVKLLAAHYYALVACEHDPRSKVFPSVANLLAQAPAARLGGHVRPYVALAHRNGAGFRIDELGSVACNGQAGVSNTFASALWLLDALVNLSVNDVDGVNLHTYPGLPNNLFDFRWQARHWTAAVHPLYYGALMFAQAAPAGSEWLRVRAGNRHQVGVWATRGGDGEMRVLMLNESTSAVRERVTVPHGTGIGRIERLRARSVYATGGITLGGRSFGGSTATGDLPSLHTDPSRSRSGAYPVFLPAGSAALLIVHGG